VQFGNQFDNCSKWVRRVPPLRGHHERVGGGEHSAEWLFRELVENLPMVTYVDLPGPVSRTLYVSPQIEEMLGYPAQAWLDDHDLLFKVLHPDDHDRMLVERRGRKEDDDTSLVFRVVSRAGRVYTVQSERVIIRDDAGVPLHILGFWVDITETVRLEEELRQAQKMEAVGRLAGGIAHDFNNLLLAQRGYGELALRRLERGETDLAADDVAEMLVAAERASRLTNQLLAFARRQVLNPEVLDLNAVVSELERMLRRLIGEDISLVARPAAAPVLVRADRGQLEQVIVNLAINARDAMPQGGRLEIAVGVTDGGSSATLEVGDNGIGMDEATVSRIFEPFFTTKDTEGTGLGLATVHGIVNQSGGRISVVSSPGNGATFTIVLPAASAEERSCPSEEGPCPPAGDATILLVEDEDGVRGGVAAMLQAHGYDVHATANAEEALEFVHNHGGDLDLLLTDLVMPGANGREIAAMVAKLRPGIAVLYMSGYADGAVLAQAGSTPRSSFIQKPFTGDELARHVRAALRNGHS
jgi:two-component system cell cycle sensor histidine kinase/response regulator CckA